MREQPFEAAEYSPLLTVLVQPSMITARQRLMEQFSKAQPDAEPEDPWLCHISVLFKDEVFKPGAISAVRHSVTLDDIEAINPMYERHNRKGGRPSTALIFQDKIDLHCVIVWLRTVWSR